MVFNYLTFSKLRPSDFQVLEWAHKNFIATHVSIPSNLEQVPCGSERYLAVTTYLLNSGSTQSVLGWTSKIFYVAAFVTIVDSTPSLFHIKNETLSTLKYSYSNCLYHITPPLFHSTSFINVTNKYRSHPTSYCTAYKLLLSHWKKDNVQRFQPSFLYILLPFRRHFTIRSNSPIYFNFFPNNSVPIFSSS